MNRSIEIEQIWFQGWDSEGDPPDRAGRDHPSKILISSQFPGQKKLIEAWTRVLKSGCDIGVDDMVLGGGYTE